MKAAASRRSRERAKHALRAIDDADRDEREILAGPNVAEAEFSGSLDSHASQNRVILRVGRKQRFPGPVGKRESLQKRHALLLGQRAKRRSVFSRKVVCELCLVRAASGGQSGGKRVSRIGFMALLLCCQTDTRRKETREVEDRDAHAEPERQGS